MKKVTILITAVTVLFAINAQNVSAAATNYGSQQCQPIYGGGESCVRTPQFEINKTVQNPQSKQYVDNLSVNDPKYAPSQTVLFKITVKNTSQDRVTNVTVKDIFPEAVEYVGGVGEYDANSRTLTIKVDKLDKAEVRDFYVQARVLAKDKLTNAQNVVCAINQSNLTAADKTAQDNAQFCIEKGLTPPTTKGGEPQVPAANPTMTKGGLPVYPPAQVKTTPETGAETIALFSLIPSALGGIFLRRNSI